MMNIFKYEFKMYIKSIIIWSLSISGLFVMFMSFYPTFGSDASIMEKMLANYPEEMLKAFGMGTGLPLSSVLGYLAFSFTFIQICLAMQAANYGFAVLSVEEREFTADFLMSKPVSRTQILSAKFAASFIALLITAAVVSITGLLTTEFFSDGNPYELDKLYMLLSSIIFFQLFFLSFGMAVSVLTRKIRNVLTYSLGLSFGTYILSAIGAIIGGKTLSYFSPFAHFAPNYVLDKGQYDMSLAWISFAVIIVSLITTYMLYPKRDIHSL